MERFGRAVAAALILGGCATAAMDGPGLQGQAVLRDKAGQQVGLATFTEGSDGLRMEVTGVGLPPGPKGVHIHAVGKCEPPDFVSAGAHFNPAGKKHGRLNPDGAHAGDMPNLTVTPVGAAGLDVTTKAVTLKEGAPASVFGAGGTSLVIHALPDDEKTDPSGNSGGRIACGVITRN
jgi:superoxide dismutase, Cu-Zn family